MDIILIFKPVIKEEPFPFLSCAQYKMQVKIIIIIIIKINK